MDYETAFKKPFTDIKKLLIGVLLGIVPIINFFVSGYIVRTAKKTIGKDSSLPEWHGWGDLFVNGILYTVIGIIFMLPAIILGLVSLWPVLPSIMSAYMEQLSPGAAAAMPDMANMMAGGMVGGLALTALLVLAAAYILPSAIVHFANNGFGAAFRLGNVFRTAFTGRYLLAWLVFAVYSSVLSWLLSRIPYAGSPIATFVAGVTGFTLLAESFAPAEVMPVKKAVKKVVVKKKKK